MELYRHLEKISSKYKKSVLALGNFDGFHRGHQVVVGEAGRIARETNCPLGIFTTEPHPRSYFTPNQPNFRLTPFRERSLHMEKFGVDVQFVPHFDEKLASTDAEDFVKRILVDQLEVSHLVTGYDYMFGKKRGGDTDLLISMGEQYGFEVTVIKPVSVGIEGAAGEIYSSTLVRDALKAGEARRAAALLGHWWNFSGIIVKGDKRGRTIGFPTANIELHDSIIPKHGVYAVRFILNSGKINFDGKVFDGVANIGTRPTFDKKGELLEVHIFNFDEEIYGYHGRVELVGFIRPEKKFSGIEELKIQITKDCRSAKRVLSDPENSRSHLASISLEDYLERFSSPYT